jgi:hypothetical protein
MSLIQAKLPIRLVVFLIGIVLSLTGSAASQAKSSVQKAGNGGANKSQKFRLPGVGVIKEARLTNGCGYYLSRTQINPKYIFLADTGAKEAFMNFDGRDTSLKFISVSRWQDTRVGARRRFVFTTGDLKISVLTIVARVSNENEMDGGLLKAFITISRGRSKKTVKVFGWNGC